MLDRFICFWWSQICCAIKAMSWFMYPFSSLLWHSSNAMPFQYSNIEYADMLFVYSVAHSIIVLRMMHFENVYQTIRGTGCPMKVRNEIVHHYDCVRRSDEMLDGSFGSLPWVVERLDISCMFLTKRSNKLYMVDYQYPKTESISVYWQVWGRS